ncbi:MAG TPA: hypothetical protein VIV60_07390 [Polyangiaceae bacterium]
MQIGQPPSWRPDVEQTRVEAYRGTVRDALGGLRNLEQLLASLRVGPRALASVLPDVRSSCPALAEAIDGLSELVGTKLDHAEEVVTPLRALARARLDDLSQVIASVEQQALNAKHRLRLQETVSTTARELEAIVELVDMLGEVVWGRTMLLDIVETAREAYRSGDPPPMASPAVRLSFRTEPNASEHTASPRAIVLLLQHLVRWSASHLPTDGIPRISVLTKDGVEITVGPGSDTDDLRWVPGRRQLPFTEQAMRLALQTMKLDFVFDKVAASARIMFPSAAGTLP